MLRTPILRLPLPLSNGKTCQCTLIPNDDFELHFSWKLLTWICSDWVTELRPHYCHVPCTSISALFTTDDGRPLCAFAICRRARIASLRIVIVRRPCSVRIIQRLRPMTSDASRASGVAGTRSKRHRRKKRFLTFFYLCHVLRF